MIKLIELLCRASATALVSSVAFSAFYFIEMKLGLQFVVHGGAWLALIGFCLAFTLIRPFLARTCESAFKNNGCQLPDAGADFLVTVTCFHGYTFICFVADVVATDVASYSSAALLLSMTVSLVSAACTLIDKEISKVFDFSHLKSLT